MFKVGSGFLYVNFFLADPDPTHQSQGENDHAAFLYSLSYNYYCAVKGGHDGGAQLLHHL